LDRGASQSPSENEEQYKSVRYYKREVGQINKKKAQHAPARRLSRIIPISIVVSINCDIQNACLMT
jgi:hypothetical protein